MENSDRTRFFTSAQGAFSSSSRAPHSTGRSPSASGESRKLMGDPRLAQPRFANEGDSLTAGP